MDIVPVPSAGNVLTVREYQQRWLGVWAFLSGQPIPRQLTLGEALGRFGIPPELPAEQAIDPDRSGDRTQGHDRVPGDRSDPTRGAGLRRRPGRRTERRGGCRGHP